MTRTRDCSKLIGNNKNQEELIMQKNDLQGKFFLPFIPKMETLIILMPATVKVIFIQYQGSRLLVNGWRAEKNSNCNIIF